MKDDKWVPWAAASGAVGVILFLVGSLIVGEPPAFDQTADEAAAYFADERTQLQVGCAFFALASPFLIWFLATVAGLARAGGHRARRAGAVAFGCGVAAVALFVADNTAIAVGALRPENMASNPAVAQALLDFSFLAMGMATFLVCAVLTAFAVLVLRDRAIWPDWLGWLAAAAAIAYGLRVGSLMTTEGIFAGDGALGFWVPVISFAVWFLVASVVLALNVRTVSEPGGLYGRVSGLLGRVRDTLPGP